MRLYLYPAKGFSSTNFERGPVNQWLTTDDLSSKLSVETLPLNLSSIPSLGSTATMFMDGSKTADVSENETHVDL